jgi:hypothetical protein
MAAALCSSSSGRGHTRSSSQRRLLQVRIPRPPVVPPTAARCQSIASPCGPRGRRHPGLTDLFVDEVGDNGHRDGLGALAQSASSYKQDNPPLLGCRHGVSPPAAA